MKTGHFFAFPSPTWRAWSLSCTVPCARTSPNSPSCCRASTASASCVPRRSWLGVATRFQSFPQSPIPRPPRPTPAPPARPAGPRPKLSSGLWTECSGQVRNTALSLSAWFRKVLLLLRCFSAWIGVKYLCCKLFFPCSYLLFFLDWRSPSTFPIHIPVSRTWDVPGATA